MMGRIPVVISAILALTVTACGSGGGGGAAVKAPSVAQPLAGSICSPLTYGGEGRPSLVAVVVGPLQNAYSDHGIQNTQSVKLVMQQHGWTAGEHRVAIQVCDEASADQPFDTDKCKRLASAIAQNPTVVAVMGPVSSGCAAAMMPLLNRAAGGPIPLVSFSNTYLGLTREGPGVEAGDPERLYPTGRRSYLRLAPADDAQAAAAVITAHDAGARRTFAVYDDSAYGKGLAAAFQAAAERDGLSPVGSAEWDPDARDYRALAARVRSTRPDAVYVGGYVTSNGPRLIRDLGAALGRDVELLAPDGFNQPTALTEGAGERTEGLVITLAAAPVQALPAAGRRWSAEFTRRWGSKPCCYAVHAGQVAEIVLDAIGRSDGGRAKVLDNLFATKVRGGLLGDFSFDRFGDTTLTSIAVYRIHGARIRFERMIEVPKTLLTRR
jgi:branched-chain amino acid transport system substrate-binding protein